MKERKRSLRICAQSLAVLLTLGMALAGCQNTKSVNPTSAGAASTSATSTITYKGTINFYPQAYNPVEATKDNPNPPTKFKEVAAAYEKIHPDIKINFVANPPSGTDYETWIKTKAAGGQLPDLVWEQWANINASPNGMWTDLVPYMNNTDPYVSGNKTWKDLFPSNILNLIKDPSGHIYVIDGDYVDTLIYYNKAMFQAAGITDTPKTWEDMITDCAKLKAANPNVAPFGMDMSVSGASNYLSWFGRLFDSNEYYNDLSSLDYDNTKGVSVLSKIVCVKKGIYSAKDPRWLSEMFTALKNFSQYWQSGYTTVPNGGVIMLFVNKKVAMYYDGTWANKSLKDDKAPDFGSFSVPQITSKTVAHGVDNINVANAVGGPNAAFQYAIPTQKADASMTDEKLKAVVDFGMFITTPENDEAVCNELAEFVPVIIGAKAPSSLSAMAEQAKNPVTPVDGAMNLTSDQTSTLGRHLQMYLLGKETLDQSVKACETVTIQTADRLIKQHPEWNIEKYLK